MLSSPDGLSLGGKRMVISFHKHIIYIYTGTRTSVLRYKYELMFYFFLLFHLNILYNISWLLYLLPNYVDLPTTTKHHIYMHIAHTGVPRRFTQCDLVLVHKFQLFLVHSLKYYNKTIFLWKKNKFFYFFSSTSFFKFYSFLIFFRLPS